MQPGHSLTNDNDAIAEKMAEIERLENRIKQCKKEICQIKKGIGKKPQCGTPNSHSLSSLRDPNHPKMWKFAYELYCEEKKPRPGNGI